MDTLDNTEWDVLIVGTGLQQSLLALALSRSDKKILHIDENDYYGGAEAAFSLQEAEEWAQRVNTGAATAAFSDVSITKPDAAHADGSSLALSASRAYSLALGPQLIYARSTLLQRLVSSRVYRQLEFLAVGSWWVYASDTGDDTLESESTHRAGKLLKVPNGREDVFQDHDLDFKAKRALMKFLRFIGEYEEQVEVWEEHRQQPFSTFLSQQFKVPTSLQGPLMALTLSPSPPDQTTTEYALPRIARHLRSIGVFGAGFGAVIPKWGGLAEISQVSCRACAVGGGVYVLGKGLDSSNTDPTETTEHGIKLRLKDREVVTAKWIVGGNTSATPEEALCRSISIVFSSLAPLFPPLAEDAPAPASAVVAFPSGSISLESPAGNPPPVQILVHSSDTGECPSGQCVLYASTALRGKLGFQLLSRAVDTLLASVDVSPAPSLLWSTQYQQRPTSGTEVLPTGNDDRVLRFPPPSADLAFDDNIFDHVKDVWEKIMGGEGGDFLVFQDREVYDDED
ncbi:Rab proteins geranylgeranyltransferase [Parastagonospora nodorum]|nr:Rab proteins geranylgeranyltransferase [Parastagonospora nodorum]KAH4029101.1 Rab proteins geranylgeranyltransferase [Parastagonospora nodorum]KAH4037993.1 Rab proteins geranylgeranyltransferase [Parastagonospora nodorum]KAH4065067.1 Rab proteins geranylgeranyltransferase [Parastagonospora nodorum]KAH4092389.1 Rab proteins geranylgeranyltransferase [Parastagonospora nodorum]